MKIIKKQICLIVTIIFALGLAGIACEGPEGPVGPQGPEGPPGSSGEQGPVGPAGADGSIIHAGEGAPDNNIGEPGDFFLDLTTGDLYGPKDEEEGWGTPTNLQGPQGPEGPQGPAGPPGEDGQDGQDGQDGADGEDGQDGADGQDGSQIFAGDGAPDNALGSAGDYYLDRTNFELYGPKTESDWGTPVNLQGPQGPQGPAGPEGPEGPQGPPGEDGEDANTTLYMFNGHDFGDSATTTLSIDLDSYTEMVQSAWLVYLYVGVAGTVNSYFHIPGYGLSIDNPDDVGPSTITDQFGVEHGWNSTSEAAEFEIELEGGFGGEYDEIHILRIEAANVVDNRSKGVDSLIPSHIDVTDYHAVMEYFGVEK